MARLSAIHRLNGYKCAFRVELGEGTQIRVFYDRLPKAAGIEYICGASSGGR
jgi:hypothetical protein